ncbi:tRNA pseudouridine synthase A [Desulfobacterium sp. N47]|uniref:tRNA pseudouridine synthase A n=1 Tax=uncultured Desulfobacterium sp. TaxID=201089 RepID=E1Y9W4_9BACT|nr:tRNA pseudouridine synthase A [uncultured Desulfobacterium sp.]
MIKNFKLTIEYDGTAFNGWQRQLNGRTIQGEIEKAIFAMTKQKIALTGAGRTDAGVHALAQVANFICDTNLEPDSFYRGLNSLLPGDIIIKLCEQVCEKFHSRYDSKSKLYRYKILNRPLPSAIGRNYLWFIKSPLDLKAMREAVLFIAGTRDFKAFEGSGSPRKSTIRTVLRSELIENEDNIIQFEIEADGFLRFMVRNIVGSLISVGLGKLKPLDIKTILDSKDRRKASATAPPGGLFLVKVRY